VRPEKIRLFERAAEAPAGSNVVEGVIRDASYLGVSTQYIVDLRGGEKVTVYEQNIGRTAHDSLYRQGETVQLGWSPDHTFVVGGAETPAQQEAS